MPENEDSDKGKEEVVLDKITKIPPLEDADGVIISNLLVQFGLFALIISLYLFIRPKVKWLYSPNVQGKPSHPCYEYQGRFNWIIPVITVNDSKLLILIGLDAFMMLQTLKFLLKIFTFLTITVLPIIGYIYWNFYEFESEEDFQYITRLSIGTHSTNSMYYYVIIFYSYAITFFIFYFIYIYYKRYTVLRQLYLRNPAILTSIITLKKLSQQLGSAEKAAEFLSLSNRTLLVSNLPDFVKTDEDLKNFFTEMKVGEIEDSVILHDTSVLRRLYQEKDEAVESIEKEVHTAVERMEKWSLKNKIDCKESISEFKHSLLETIGSIKLDKTVSADKKKSLLNIFRITDDRWKTVYRNQVKALDYWFDTLHRLLSDIAFEKNRLKQENAIEDTSHIIELAEEQNALFIPGEIDRDASFFSFYHFVNMRKYSAYFSLDLPFGSRKGFVVFKHFKDASIVKQAKIGSKVFTVIAEDAPTPNDIIWENVNKGGMYAFILRACANLAFFVFNVVFTLIVVYVIDMVQLDRFSTNGIVIKFFNSHPKIKTLYKGNIPALMYNLMLLFVPMIISALVNLEGIASFSAAQKKTMSKYTNFLFFNGFISVFFATTIYSNFKKFVEGNLTFDEFVENLGDKILASVALFINTAIQKALFGVAMLLLKPGPLIVNHTLRNLFASKTRRQTEQAEFAPPFDFGNTFPDLLIVFPMLFVYTLICPTVLLPGTCYFFIVYCFYKNDFLYASRNHYESGGRFWEQAVTLVIYSVLIFQIATASVIFSHSQRTIAACFIPLFYITYMFCSNLDEIFGKSCNCFPLNFQESLYLDEFTKKLKKDRLNLLDKWEEFSQISDIDNINLEDFGYTDKKDIGSTSYYKDPATTTSLTNLLLPKNFFRLLFVLKEYDKNNLFGYRNSAI
ncbi:hypothetical protein P3W45_000996 [Vairimorpha bombi]|jgi:calcium permeable stress-gated cation channel